MAMLGDAEKIVEMVKAYLSESFQAIPYQDFFIVDEERSILIDLDWPKIREYLLQSFVNTGYFIQNIERENIFNLFDYACFIDLYPPNSYLAINPNFFKSETLYIQLKKIRFEFPAFWEQLHTHSYLMDTLIKFVKHSNESKFIEKDDLDKLKIILFLDFSILNEKHKEDFYSFFRNLIAFNRFNPLLFAVQEHTEILKTLLNFLAAHPELMGQERLQTLFLEKTTQGCNVLGLAAQYHPEGLKTLLNFLVAHPELIGQERLQTLFLEKMTQGCNILGLAARYNVAAFQPLLNFLAAHLELIGQERLKRLFLEKTPWGLDVLSLTAQYHPEVLPSLLSFLTVHPELISQGSLKTLFLERTKEEGCDIPTMLLGDYPEIFNHLLNFMDENYQLIDKDILQEIFLQKFYGNRDILNMVVKCRPLQCKQLLMFLEKHPQLLGKKNLQKLFLRETDDGQNALILIAENQAENWNLLLDFFYKKSEWFDKYFLGYLFLQKDKSFWYSLILKKIDQSEAVDYFTKNLLGYYGLPDKKTLSLLRIPDGSLNISQVIVLITAYLEKIEKRLYSCMGFLQKNTRQTLQEKKLLHWH